MGYTMSNKTSGLREGFVLQVCHGRKADGPYYQGDGEWGQFEYARIYYTRGQMRSGIAEAKKAKPDDLAEICAFGVYLP